MVLEELIIVSEKTILITLTKTRYFISSRGSLYKTFHLQLEENSEFIFAVKSKAASNLVTMCCRDIESCVLVSTSYLLTGPLLC